MVCRIADFTAQSVVTITSKPARCSKILASFEQVKTHGPRGEVGPQLAGELCGNLGFICTTSLFGRVGRAPCLSLVNRMKEGWKGKDGSSSDAEGDEIGIVCFDTRSSDHPGWYSHFPSWLSLLLRADGAALSVICPVELIAAVVALLTFGDKCRGRKVLFWIDNAAAWSSMVHGYSSSGVMQIVNWCDADC